MRVLLIEDNAELADTLKLGLEQIGCDLDHAGDGIEGEVMARTQAYDVLLVDWMLPGQDGVTLLRRLRAEGIGVPALMLTARADPANEVEGLDAGADDYLTKPFSFDVLSARVRALGRRSRTSPSADPSGPHVRLGVGALQLDLRDRTAVLGREPLELREKEFRLLAVLADPPGRAVSRLHLAEQVWGDAYTSDDTLNTTISRLRRELARAVRAGVPDAAIDTLRGVGYRLRVAEHG